MNKFYQNYLNSSYWKKRREEFKSKTWKRCFLCREKINLEVHHKRYRDEFGSILFREKHTDFRLLCKNCHSAVHKHNLVEILAEGKVKRHLIRDYIKKLKTK